MQRALQDLFTKLEINVDWDQDFAIEVQPRPEAISFSRPLCITKDKQDLHLAHYTQSEWDIDYNPWIIIDLNTWQPRSVYRFYQGQLKVGVDLGLEEALTLLDQWAQDLLEQGYSNPKEAQWIRCTL